MNNKTIIEFSFRILWRILEISEGVIRLGLGPRQITPSSFWQKFATLIPKKARNCLAKQDQADSYMRVTVKFW